MPEIPTSEPLTVIAGDTIKFKKTWSDYPTADWTLSYVLHSRSKDTSNATATVTEDGKYYVVTFSAAQTADFTPEDYSLHGRITNGIESYTVYDGILAVRRNVAAASSHDEMRTFAARALEAVETAILGSLGSEFVSFSVDGQSFTRMPREEAMRMRDQFKAEVIRENRAERIRQGIGTSRNVYTRFT